VAGCPRAAESDLLRLTQSICARLRLPLRAVGSAFGAR